jgi:hypothetical protein
MINTAFSPSPSVKMIFIKKEIEATKNIARGNSMMNVKEANYKY